MTDDKSVVLAALFANAAIAILKFAGYLLTGSPSMLSETYHSASDVGNQVFLLIGIRYSERRPTRQHPFGFGKAQFFYSFVVSVLLFGVAGAASALEGYHSLVGGESTVAGGVVRLAGVVFPAVYVNYAILVGGLAFEGYGFRKGYAALSEEVAERQWGGIVEGYRKSSRTSTLAALTEDTVALGGLALALVGVVLSELTGNPVFDAAGALSIGVLLMIFAVVLAWENKQLLLGESLPREEENQLREIIDDHEGVLGIVDFRSTYFGPGRLLVAADVTFEPTLDVATVDACIDDIERELREADEHVAEIYIEPEAETNFATDPSVSP